MGWKDEGQIIFSSANYWLNCVSWTKCTAQTRFSWIPPQTQAYKHNATFHSTLQNGYCATTPPPCYLPDKLHACPLRTYRLGPTLRQCSIRVHFRSGTHTRWYNPLHLQKRRSIQQPDKMWPEKYVQFLLVFNWKIFETYLWFCRLHRRTFHTGNSLPRSWVASLPLFHFPGAEIRPRKVLTRA